MLEVEDDIYDNYISEITAYLIGWHDEPEDWYKEMVPAGWVDWKF